MTYPKGYLVAVGGAADNGTDLERGIIERNRLNFFELGILRNVIKLVAADGDPVVEVITTASQIPDEVAVNYTDAFNKLGLPALAEPLAHEARLFPYPLQIEHVVI